MDADPLARAAITRGRLRLITPEGEIHDFGQGSPEAELQLHDWSVVTACAAKGDIGLGETYVAGLWDTPSIADLCEVSLLNLRELERFAYLGLWARLGYRLLNSLFRANSRKGSPRNIRAHYDVGNEFYSLWLDPGMTYSSALFDAGADLEGAQTRKNARILDKLAPGESILEVGCGWGGFAEQAAERGQHVTAEIRLQDYREARGRFDNIVSIEMIEAVGERYWPTYFATLKDRLAEDGRAVLQVITVPDDYFPTYRSGSDYIRQHIFPGGMLLAPGIFRREAAKAGLVAEDPFFFGQDYARTCRIWHERMNAEETRIKRLGMGEEFLRSWRFYLGSCAAAFTTGQTDVMQVALSHAEEA